MIDKIINIIISIIISLKLSWYDFRRQQVQDTIEKELLIRKQIDRRINKIKEEYNIEGE